MTYTQALPTAIANPATLLATSDVTGILAGGPTIGSKYIRRHREDLGKFTARRRYWSAFYTRRPF